MLGSMLVSMLASMITSMLTARSPTSKNIFEMTIKLIICKTLQVLNLMQGRMADLLDDKLIILDIMAAVAVFSGFLIMAGAAWCCSEITLSRAEKENCLCRDAYSTLLK